MVDRHLALDFQLIFFAFAAAGSLYCIENATNGGNGGRALDVHRVCSGLALILAGALARCHCENYFPGHRVF